VNALNLPGYKILDFKQNKYDYLYMIEPEEPPYVCIHCGSIDVKFTKHSVRYRDVVDIPSQGKRVLLRIKHRRYKCSACGETFYEPLNGIDTFAKATKRLKEYIMEQAVKRSYEDIGDEVGLSSQTVKRYFDEVVMEIRNNTKIKAPRVLGIDEVYICKRARAVLMDIEKGIMIEMLESNTKVALKAFISSMEGYENIEAVTMDMCPAYKYVCKELIPNAKVIIDKFHVIAFANKALLKYFNAIKNKANTAETQELWGVRKILLTGKEKLTPDKIAKRDAIFKKYDELRIAYWLKEDLRDVYLAADSKEAFELFYLWEESVPKSMKHFVKIKNTLNRCKQEVINYFKFPNENLTNSFTESMNRVTKDYIRLGRNYSFETVRAKALLRQHIEVKPKIGELGFS